MGRHSKAVLTSAGIDRRDTGYYSTPAPVGEFFRKKLLALNPAPELVFDPCAGRGELLAPFRDCGARLCGFDIMDMQPGRFFDFERRDFLLAAAAAPDRPPVENGLPDADIIVANPPYNCHEHDYLRGAQASASPWLSAGARRSISTPCSSTRSSAAPDPAA